MKNTQQLGWRS